MSEKQNAEMMKLLPCPFCGRSAHITEDDSRFFIGCDDCFCAVGEAYDGCAMPAHCFYEEEAAIDAWNNRAAASHHAGGAEMLELAGYLKEQAERLRRILKREVVPGRPQFDSCLHAFTSAENTVRQILLRAAAPSPHPRGEPVAWRFRFEDVKRWTLLHQRPDYADDKDVICEPLYAAPPPAGTDAVREALEAAKEFADDEFSESCDLNHKNRVLILCDKIDVALALLPAPQPQEKPTGDQT